MFLLLAVATTVAHDVHGDPFGQRHGRVQSATIGKELRSLSDNSGNVAHSHSLTRHPHGVETNKINYK